MAGLYIECVTSSISTGNGSARQTALQLAAPTNQRVKIKEWSASFQGTSNTQKPILVEIIQQNSAGTGLTANNPTKVNTGDQESVQTTGQKGFAQSVEPTTTAVVQQEYVHPQTGYTWQAPFGGELIIQGGKWLGIVVTADTVTPMVARFLAEE